MTCDGEYGVHGSVVESSSCGLGTQARSSLVVAERRPVRAVLDRSPIAVRGGEDPLGHRQGGTTEAAWVSRTVETLAVGLGDRCLGLQSADPAEDAAGEVGVEADALPIRLGQCRRLLPHGVRDAHPAQVVHQRCSSYPVDVALARSPLADVDIPDVTLFNFLFGSPRGGI